MQYCLFFHSVRSIVFFIVILQYSCQFCVKILRQFRQHKKFCIIGELTFIKLVMPGTFDCLLAVCVRSYCFAYDNSFVFNLQQFVQEVAHVFMLQGYRSGYSYRNPVIVQHKPRQMSDIQLPATAVGHTPVLAEELEGLRFICDKVFDMRPYRGINAMTLPH